MDPTTRPGPRLRALPASLPLFLLCISAAAVTGAAIITDLTLVRTLHEPRAEHADQYELLALVRAGRADEAFEAAFELGDELFETRFNALDGVGANVGNGQRFSRVPRADLSKPGAWASHVPARATGPNAESCNSCHNQPFDDGAGGASSNVHRDPLHTGELRRFIERNTPHLFAPGAVQRLAEEMTAELHAQRESAEREVRRTRRTVTIELKAKGLDFGKLTAWPSGRWGRGSVRIDTSRVAGVAPDLIVRPFQWKGSVLTVRDFNRGASHNEIGMQPVELTGDGVDGDSDGVTDEMTVGDQTALAVYVAAQPRPVTKLELDTLGLIPPLSNDEKAAIRHGFDVFRWVGCADCHSPSMTIDDPVFSEPSQSEHYRDKVFPAGQDPVAMGVRPDYPITFDLTEDQPDNRIQVGGQVVLLGSLRKVNGKAVVELFGDLRRHRLGQQLAESIDDDGVPADTFLTENLWGVGSTAPYLHDGRATTLTEAILEHGGEAARSRQEFLRLPQGEQEKLIAFLDNLVLFKQEED